MPPLLERDAELAALEAVVGELAAGHGRLVLVGGEAGIGKTSLVRELRRRTASSARFFVAGCEALSVPAPLAPVRELAEAAGAGDVADRAGDPLALARSLLRALSAHAPVVAVVEDAHWADPATLDVLRLLARRLEDVAVAVVITYRDDEVDASSELRRLLGDLATRPAVERLALSRLSEATLRALAQGAGIDADRLARLTGGNPFLVVESIAAGGKLPESVRNAVLARAARLGRAAREAVVAAAAIGPRVDPRLLEAVLPGSGEAVEEALAHGVVVSDGPLLGFRHELMREAIEASTSPPRRADLHARVLDALASGAFPADNARLAHHAELAGRAGDAARYAALAAADAERLGALREAALQAERALRLGSLAEDERLDVLLLHSRAANFASVRLEDAAESAEEAIALATRLGDRVRLGRALVALAAALWSLDDVGRARAVADRAVEVLEGSGDAAAQLARAHAMRVRMEATAFDPRVALELGPRALQLAEQAGLEQTRVDVAISVALARGHRGDSGALEVPAETARAARAAGLTIETVRAYVNLVFLASTLRRHDVVDAATGEALALFDEYQTTIPANAVQLYRARSLLDRGRWDEADATFTLRGREWAAEAPVVLAWRGLVGARRGEAGAGALVERGWAELGGVPESSRHALVQVALVEAAWLRGDVAAAALLVQAAQRSAATRFARAASDLASWARRVGVEAEPPAGAPEPVVHELAGDWRAAVRAWREREAPYEAALAALPGDERAARDALAALHALGAEGAARAFARARESLGARAVRGPRPSTRVHPAGLTRREQEVLEQLATGATNAGIAAALHLSERTVAHHVSAILRKLGAATRLAAVERARARGLVRQVGQPPQPR